jgi:hypothetical protein
MRLLPKQLRNEHYSYLSNKPVDQITNDLEKIFNNKHLFRELTGEFIDKNTFLVSSNIAIGFNKAPLYSFTRMQGKISERNDKTILDIVIKPHMIIYPFFFGFLIFGLLSIISILGTSEDITIKCVIVTIIFTFIIPFITAFYGQVAKDNLREKFINTLKL